MAKKLVIVNNTKWSTRALRSVFLKVINENIKHEGPLKHLLRVTVVNSRRQWGGFSGYAYLHSGTMRLRLPKLGLDDDDKLDVFRLGYLFEHELAHCRGYQHKGMGCLNSWASANEKYYPYLRGMSVGRQAEKLNPEVDIRRTRYERVLGRIRSWESKAKRARTALKKLAAQRTYYERNMKGGAT